MIEHIFAGVDDCTGLTGSDLSRCLGQTIIGNVSNPLNKYDGVQQGLAPFLSNILRLVFVVAGIYAFFNLIIAGYQYMSAAGDTKALAAAWARIWQSLIGLVIIVGSFALAALFGYLLFGDPTYMLTPRVFGPNQ